MNAKDAHASVGIAAAGANPYADNTVDANANDADAAYKADGNANANKDDNLLEEVDPFPVLSCKERSRFIEKQHSWHIVGDGDR